jgi:hypothetical protein
MGQLMCGCSLEQDRCWVATKREVEEHPTLEKGCQLLVMRGASKSITHAPSHRPGSVASQTTGLLSPYVSIFYIGRSDGKKSICSDLPAGNLLQVDTLIELRRISHATNSALIRHCTLSHMIEILEAYAKGADVGHCVGIIRPRFTLELRDGQQLGLIGQRGERSPPG